MYFDLDKIKQGLSELPKDDSTKIYLLDTYGKDHKILL